MKIGKVSKDKKKTERDKWARDKKQLNIFRQQAEPMCIVLWCNSKPKVGSDYCARHD